MAARRRSEGMLSLLVATLGGLQAALLVLAFMRVLDPGWPVTGAIGSLAGLGMASVAALVWARYAAEIAPIRVLAPVAVAAGLVSAGVWGSLFGGMFSTADYPRIALLLGADVIFTLWTICAAVALRGSWLPGLRDATVLLTIRSIAELAVVPLFVRPQAGPGDGMVALLIVPFAIGFGWLVLAAWEIGLGVAGVGPQVWRPRQDSNLRPSA